MSLGFEKERVVVMFDWDNTIMASADFLRGVHEETAERLKGQGIELKKGIPAIATKKKEDILKDLFGEEHLSDVLPVFEEVYNKRFKPIDLKMLPGAREQLEKLNVAGIPVAIVSNYTEVGIKEHLDLRQIEHDKIVIVGVDTECGGTKPNVAPGLFALEALNIDPTAEKVRVLMIGDGINSDMAFAENMDRHLKELNSDSSCTGMLFNAFLLANGLLSNDPIFDKAQVEKDFLSKEGSSAEFKRAVVFGYGRIGSTIRNTITPTITEKMLQEQAEKLKSVPVKASISPQNVQKTNERRKRRSEGDQLTQEAIAFTGGDLPHKRMRK